MRIPYPAFFPSRHSFRIRWVVPWVILLLVGGSLPALEWPPAPGESGGGGVPFPGVARVQQAPATVIGTFHVKMEGSEIRGLLLLEIPGGWKLFHTHVGPEGAMDLPLELTFEAPGVEWEPPLLPRPRRYENRLLDPDPRQAWRLVHEGEVQILVRGRVVDDPPSPDAIRVQVDGQMCSDTGQCVLVNLERTANTNPDGTIFEPDASLFATFPADAPVPPSEKDTRRVDPEGESAQPEEGGSGKPEGQGRTTTSLGDGTQPLEEKGFVIRGQRDSGLAWTLVLAFLAGVILNFTPCVLPVISIRIMALAQQREEVDPRRGVLLGVVFAAGVLSVFLVLGVLAAVFGHIWGQQFQSIPFLIALVSIVFAFSLSLFGVFEMFAPNVHGGGRNGTSGVRVHTTFLMGAVATLLATPCAGPLVGSTLAWALSQPWHVIMLVFALMGLGMAMPYVILTAHPSFLGRMPRPGAWMKGLKTGIGFFLLAAVVYLMRGLPAEILLQVMTYFLFVAVACRMWGVWGTPLRRTRVRVFAGLGAGLLLGGGWWICFHGVSTPTGGHDGEGRVIEAEGMWEVFSPQRLEEAREAGRGVLLKWTADWCTNCKINDRLVYDTPEIRAAVSSSGVVALVADLTRQSAESEEARFWLQRLGGSAIPYAVVIDPDGRTVEPFPDLIRRETLRRHLEALGGSDLESAAASAPASE